MDHIFIIDTSNVHKVWTEVSNFLNNYFQEIILVSIPGIINSYQATKEAKQLFPHLPLLKLHTYVGFWIVLFIFDFGAVSGFFGWLYSVDCMPGLKPLPVLQAFVFGFAFVNISRSKKVNLLALDDFNFNSIYISVKQDLYDFIKKKEEINTAKFWRDFRQQLMLRDANEINDILDALINCYELKRLSISRRSRSFSSSVSSSEELNRLIAQARRAQRNPIIRSKVKSLMSVFRGLDGYQIKDILLDYKFDKIVDQYYTNQNIKWI